MSEPKDYGVSSDGTVLADEVIERVQAEAEAGYDVDDLLKRRERGRPPMGSAAADALAVRLDPDLRASVVERAEHDGVPQGEVVRRALRQYLAS
ncbi:ribbon-helix-helix domain-containing protein [Acidiferrimicrobium sp. IK]|uniref:ribbon-helix-helix domain-containing protein n=1 Tax=Acidiferrimicrobium sp. IK TaxID=2871700 RepID=UPI0021CB7413|nr:CopG family transcriptional regulator [Acidiferrimicrobium sp. IK]MCU4185584.1 ribbon-helix-helix domain-containing protein [Acidiferrimicrobium sp. IK]